MDQLSYPFYLVHATVLAWTATWGAPLAGFVVLSFVISVIMGTVLMFVSKGLTYVLRA